MPEYFCQVGPSELIAARCITHATAILHRGELAVSYRTGTAATANRTLSGDMAHKFARDFLTASGKDLCRLAGLGTNRVMPPSIPVRIASDYSWEADHCSRCGRLQTEQDKATGCLGCKGDDEAEQRRLARWDADAEHNAAASLARAAVTVEPRDVMGFEAVEPDAERAGAALEEMFDDKPTVARNGHGYPVLTSNEIG